MLLSVLFVGKCVWSASHAGAVNLIGRKRAVENTPYSQLQTDLDSLINQCSMVFRALSHFWTHKLAVKIDIPCVSCFESVYVNNHLPSSR